MLNIDIGDIVLVNHFKYPDGTDGSLHSFVVMDIKKDELEIITLEYLCFLISSNTNKGNDINPAYPYNEPIYPTSESGLQVKSHVKCDQLFSIPRKDDIIMRVGIVTPAQYERFVELYRKYQTKEA